MLREALAPAYDIERLLGRGGMARVFLARDRKHDRHVALKVIDAELATGLAAERFLREIQLCARLTHPHILPLLDSGFAGDRPYYTMPFVSGQSVRERLEQHGRFPVEEAVTLAREVADALDYAHAAGVVHRDVKPENVLLLGGHAVVLDFGVGRALSAANKESDGITIVGTVVGTPAYMSPEQAAGEADVDGRSDEYSLAVMLFELLTGGQLFTGPSVQAIIAKRFRETPPPIDSLRPDVPGRVSRALARALATEPGDRYPTVGEFGRALVTSTDEMPAMSPVVAGPSIAVVPFANVGGEPENEYLADGITDEVISALSRLRTLRVAARTSSYALRGHADDVATIGARLKVRSILEGSVQRAGQRIRVTARLVNVADGFQVWSEQFDRMLDDVFAIQDEISSAIVRTLEATFLGKTQAYGALSHTTGAEVYELYLKGRFFWNKRTEGHLAHAVELFSSAVAKDSRYAPAYAGLADAWGVLGTYGARPPQEAMPRAKENAERALALDPSLAPAHATLGLVYAAYDRNWKEAEASFRRAITLDPADAKARQWFAVALLAPLGRSAEAEGEISRALVLDPLSVVVQVTAGLVHGFAREHDAAIEHFRDALALEQGFSMGHYFLAQALASTGRPSEALESVDRAVTLTGGSPEMLSLQARARHAAGDAAGAMVILGGLERLRESRYVSPALIAQVYIALGRDDTALAWLERALAERDAELLYLRVRPVYDALRERPEFRALMQRAGFDGS